MKHLILHIKEVIEFQKQNLNLDGLSEEQIFETALENIESELQHITYDNYVDTIKEE